MIKISLFFFCLLGVSSMFAQSNSRAICPVIPTPVVYQKTSGAFEIIDKHIFINSTNLPLEIGNYLKDQLQKAFSINASLQENQGVLIFKKIKNVPQHSYSIDIDQNITITYSSDESCFYAVNTFLQLIEENEVGTTIQKCFINDSPKFNWRGLHLDVSRHFFYCRRGETFYRSDGIVQIQHFSLASNR